MKRKMMLMSLAGAFALYLSGCGEEEAGPTSEENAPTTGTETVQEGPTVQPVPDGQPGAPGTAQGPLAQERTQYIQGAEQILNEIEQKFTAWQQQAGAQGQQAVQELSKQLQEQLADARAAVDRMRAATGTELKEAKVAADQAIQNAQEAFRNFQTRVGQTQVTQVE